MLYDYAYTLFFLFLPLLAHPKPRKAFPKEREEDEDTLMDYDDCTCLSWKKILNLVDNYYKVNSFLVDSNALIYENVILPKPMHWCMIRFDGETSIARERREAVSEGNLIYALGRSGRQAHHGRRSPSGTTDQVKIIRIRVWIDKSS
jgi:hypothetical protein